MIGIDTNVLVYSHRRDMPQHENAAAALESLLTGPEAAAVCWPVIHEFLAVVTNPRVFTLPTTVEAAVAQVRHWVSSNRVLLLHETPGHLDLLERLCIAGDAHGAVVHDARVAAIYAGHGVREVWSADRDFTRFPGLRVVNPLI